jgi:hypothetical protein
MRITVNYFEGYPELEAELAKHSPRARAERMRFLAAMGLAFMNDGRAHAGVAPAAGPVATPATPAPTSATSGKGPSSTAKSIARSVFRQAEDE